MRGCVLLLTVWVRASVTRWHCCDGVKNLLSAGDGCGRDVVGRTALVSHICWRAFRHNVSSVRCFVAASPFVRCQRSVVTPPPVSRTIDISEGHQGRNQKFILGVFSHLFSPSPSFTFPSLFPATKWLLKSSSRRGENDIYSHQTRSHTPKCVYSDGSAANTFWCI